MHESIKPPRRRVRSPWVWAAAALLAAALLGASALRFASASCAATLPTVSRAAVNRAAVNRAAVSGPPSATQTSRGQAYYYNPAGGQGSCSFGPLPAGGLYVSLSPPQYANGASCGSYLEVTGPDGRVQAEVVDLCPGCTAGGLDLSEAAFSRVASQGAGTAAVSYHLVRDPRPAQPLEVRVAPSASAAWLALQVLGHGNPLRSVAVAPDRPGSHGSTRSARWQPLAPDPDGYWTAPAGAGTGPFLVRVTDVFGHQAVAGGIRLWPGSVQHTSVTMYPVAASPAGPAPPTPSPSTTMPPPSPVPSSGGPSGSGAPGHAALGGYPNASGSTGPHC
jgi:expansin (peptidoglycan-binding protein)